MRKAYKNNNYDLLLYVIRKFFSSQKLLTPTVRDVTEKLHWSIEKRYVWKTLSRATSSLPKQLCPPKLHLFLGVTELESYSKHASLCLKSTQEPLGHHLKQRFHFRHSIEDLILLRLSATSILREGDKSDVSLTGNSFPWKLKENSRRFSFSRLFTTSPQTIIC